jgi:hypothetical protein
MQRVVFISGRTITLGNYVRAWKTALAAPPNAIFEKGFTWYSQTKAEVLREFQRGLHDRINRRIDGFPGTLKPMANPVTRKREYQWQLETYRAAQRLNHPRLIIDYLPPWLKKRFAHRLRENMID